MKFLITCLLIAALLAVTTLTATTATTADNYESYADKTFASVIAELKRFKRILRKQQKHAPVATEQTEQIEQADSTSTIGAGITLKATTSLNVRNGACTNKGIVKTLNPGETVKTTGWQGSDCGYLWYGVQGSFGYGYVASNFVQQVGGGGNNPQPQPQPQGGDLSVAQLQRIMPRISSAKASQYIGYLNAAMREAGITTCCRKTAFLAQLAHESGDLNWFEEFASGAAYEGRKDLGNTQPGDGKRYKGRGPIQLTGRANYRAAGRALGIDLEGNPTLAAQPNVGFRTAAWFWNTRSLNSYADCTQGGFDQITRRINGGYNGKADRDAHWKTARGVLGC